MHALSWVEERVFFCKNVFWNYSAVYFKQKKCLFQENKCLFGIFSDIFVIRHKLCLNFFIFLYFFGKSEICLRSNVRRCNFF